VSSSQNAIDKHLLASNRGGKRSPNWANVAVVAHQHGGSVVKLGGVATAYHLNLLSASARMVAIMARRKTTWRQQQQMGGAATAPRRRAETASSWRSVAQIAAKQA